MKNRRSLLIALAAVCLAFAAGIFWRWVQETPRYALYQIGAGLKHRDVDRLLPYVDLRGILNRQLSETLSAAFSEELKEVGRKHPSLRLGEVEVRLSPEADRVLADWVLKELRKYLKESKNPTLPSSFALVIAADINRKGEYALVTLKTDRERLRLGMKREEGVWRVVELNHEDVQRLIKRFLRSKGA